MLSKELAENSGMEDPLAGLFETWFGKWGELARNMLISIVMAATVLTLCGCCCISCVQGFLQRFIDTSLTKIMFLQNDLNELYSGLHSETDEDEYKNFTPDSHV